MYVFPAIDLYQGKVVRLAQGDYDRVTVYDDNPVARAAGFAAAGASWLHIVDLEGARTGVPVTGALIGRIAAACPGVRIEVGGGVRTEETATQLLETGADRVVLGTRLAYDFPFAGQLVSRLGSEHIVAGIDARAGKVAVAGWTEESALSAPDLVARLAEAGIRHLVYTDIARDGMQTGIDPTLYREVAAAAGFPVVVSGGVSSLADFAALRALGERVVEGVITGRALYEHAFTLDRACAVLERGEEPAC